VPTALVTPPTRTPGFYIPSFPRNDLGTFSDNAIYEFSKKAVENGLDIFRVFDSLNYFGESAWCCLTTNDTHVSAQKTYVLESFLLIFPCLTHEQMRLGIDAAKKAGGVVEAVVCYSGDVASPRETKYTLQYYLDFVNQLVKEGIHVLGVKDMAGLLKPRAATLYVRSPSTGVQC
jgi:pyruvate carboxylase